MSRPRIAAALAAVSLLALASPVLSANPKPVRIATADLINAYGQIIGSARLDGAVKGKLLLTVKATRLPKGSHGMHLHAVGKCETPSFLSAGPHLAAPGETHGKNSGASGPHAGDLPDLIIAPNGAGTRSANLTEVAMEITSMARPVSILDGDGTAIIIHASMDDQTTQPTGNSGPRIACGKFRAQQ